MLDFPNSPIAGQQFTAAGVTWTFDGAKWLPSGLSPLVVPGINDNRIINGDMRIDQRNNGATGTAIAAYTVDRWKYGSNVAGKGTWGRVTSGSGLASGGFGYQLTFASGSSYVAAATEFFVFVQPIEADMIVDFMFGTANAQPVTLSFWAMSSIVGTFSGSLNSYTGSSRAYPFTYSLPNANIWTRIAITIPGDTAGAWVLQGNAAGIAVYFDLGSGANYRGPAGAWASANYTGATGSISVVGTSGAQLLLTGVKLEIGNVATPYNRQSLAKSMADCQRYYQFLPSLLTHTAYGQGSVTYAQNNILPVQMRAAPTAGISNLTNVTNAASGAVGTLNNSRFISQAQVVATGQSYFYGDYALSAEF